METNIYRRCGIPKYGLSRIRCTNDNCGEEYILLFSCKDRGIFPSCMQKHMREAGDFITHTIAMEVPHWHIIFTIPKLMRKNIYWHRTARNDLLRMAWRCTLAFMRGTLKCDGRPGAVIGIETSGEYLDLNPHVHMVVTDGLYTPGGNSITCPDTIFGIRLPEIALGT
ncbi:MAG: transposase zinc-binding domain-containing protein [Spirochaetes bacterium]|nr:transposase zinc-binding domain-containing protein [Spirochaetota bacterium]